MGRDYDNQLLESVAVRRQRLREAVLFGSGRTRRRLDENIGKVVVSACLAAAACAGSVGWSFITTTLSDQELEREQAESAPAENAVPPVPGDWVGEQVTLDMLRDELEAAGVEEHLYVLPGDPRPEPSTVSSYYFLTPGAEGNLEASVMDFDQGRTNEEFGTEDEAARWLYQELATTESDPAVLSPTEEEEAREETEELVEAVQEGLEQRSGDSYLHELEPGDHIDAFGPEAGRHLHPDGTPYAERGLPDHVRTGADGDELYHRYRVVHPFQVTAAIAPDEGGNPGGGVRFTLDTAGFPDVPPAPTLRWLVANGYVERVAVNDVPQ